MNDNGEVIDSPTVNAHVVGVEIVEAGTPEPPDEEEPAAGEADEPDDEEA